MSALPPKADIAGRQLDVRFVPEADLVLLRSITSSAHLGGKPRRRQRAPVAAGCMTFSTT
jgi:hypothetical protein